MQCQQLVQERELQERRLLQLVRAGVVLQQLQLQRLVQPVHGQQLPQQRPVLRLQNQLLQRVFSDGR